MATSPFSAPIPPSQGRPREEQEKKRLVFEMAVESLIAFFKQLKEMDSSKAASDREEKLENIEEQVSSGKISLEAAASEIMNIADQVSREQSLSVPKLGLDNPDDPKQLIVDHVKMFTLFLQAGKEREGSPARTNPTLLFHAHTLFENAENGYQSPEEAAKALNELIDTANRLLPREVHYPLFQLNLI